MRAELLEEARAFFTEHGRLDLLPCLKSSLPAAEVEKSELTSAEAAALLGVSSPNTVKKWLEGGHFPGAYKTPGKHWRLPRKEVLAVKARLAELQAKNQAGDVSPPDHDGDDESDVPLL